MSDRTDPNRRSVLRRIGETTMAVSLLGGPALASRSERPVLTDSLRSFMDGATGDLDEATRRELLERYADPAAIRAEFEAATPVLEALAEAGHLDSASLSELAFEEIEIGDVKEPAAASVGIGVDAIDHPDGASAHLSVTPSSTADPVAIYRQPELDVTFAIVASAGQRFVFHDVDDDVSITKDCGWEFVACVGGLCDYGDPPQCYEQQRYCCLLPDGSYECSDTRYVCGCDC